MASTLMDSLFGNATGADLNPTIGLNAIAAAASSCTAYLAATLQSTTPEVHRLFGEYLNQSLIAHEGLTGLAIKRGWMQPYISPEQQLKMSYQNAESIMQHADAQQ
jgi:spore coat protein CotF